MRLRILDLFCGAGGFSLGFQPPISTHLAIDIDPYPLATLAINQPSVTTLQADIRVLHSQQIEQFLGGRPDIIIASPPCEEYSLANPTSEQPAVDRVYGTGTARLLLDAIRIIGDLEPTVFVIENVAAILRAGGREIIRHELERVGIDDVFFNLIRAERHGLPSKRLRVFISNIPLRLPQQRSPTVMGAIGDLPSLGVDALFEMPKDIPNHTLRILPDSKQKLVRKAKRGRGAQHFKSRGRTIPNWVRLFPNQVATSINGLSRYIHPYEDRLLTVREHARLMSYPDEYIFSGPVDSQYNQVGESVPPLISHLISKEVQMHID
ncbi:MAG: DNA cytosine methyltransferase [Candidatus Thorarchaeota archaeon]|nr:DNA cytosine methyltransferase [Candidatus Thorarchaeota archaeon]